MKQQQCMWRLVVPARALGTRYALGLAFCLTVLILAWMPACGNIDGGLPAASPGIGGDPVDEAPDDDPPPSTGGSNSGGSNSGGSTANPDVSDPCILVGMPASPTHREMFDALNAYRASRSLATLAYSKVLEKAANAHALDMYRRDYFDHTSPEGYGPDHRAVVAGFCRIRTVAENLAWNQQSVAEVQTAWENSPGHNANMINPGYRYVGMGYYFSANGPYYVQLFGDVHPN